MHDRSTSTLTNSQMKTLADKLVKCRNLHSSITAVWEHSVAWLTLTDYAWMNLREPHGLSSRGTSRIELEKTMLAQLSDVALTVCLKESGLCVKPWCLCGETHIPRSWLSGEPLNPRLRTLYEIPASSFAPAASPSTDSKTGCESDSPAEGISHTPPHVSEIA